MKKSILLIIFTASLLSINFTVKAASTCSSEREMELSSLANNINVDYQEYDKATGSDYDDFYDDNEEEKTTTLPAFYIHVYNLTNDLNLSVIKDGQAKGTTVYYSNLNSDGVLYLDSSYANTIKNYTIKVRSNDSNCQNEVLRTITITVPMQNYFHNYQACIDNPDFYLCQEYTTSDYSEISTTQFEEELSSYKVEKEETEKKESSWWYKLGKFLDTYKWLFITAAILIIGSVIYIVIRNKKRSKLI